MTKTVKEIVDAYNNSSLVKSIIDSYVEKEGFHEVVIVSNSTEYKEGIITKFEDVVSIKQTSNNILDPEQTYGIVHSTMLFGNITDLYTEIYGKPLSMTKTLCTTRKYQEK